MANQNTIAVIARKISEALAPLQVAISSHQTFVDFMRGLGWDVTTMAIPQPVQDLGSGLTTLVNKLESILEIENVSLSDIEELLDSINAVVDGIEAIRTSPDSLIPQILRDDNFKEEFPRQLLDYLIVEYLIYELPVIANVLELLGIIRIDYKEANGNRPAYISKRLVFEDIPKIFQDPFALIQNVYGWGTDEFNAIMLFEHLEDLLINLGAYIFIERPQQELVELLESGAVEEDVPDRKALKVSLFEQMGDGGILGAGIGLFALPMVGSRKAGLALLPYAAGSFEQRFEIISRLFLYLNSNFNIQGGIGIILRPDESIQIITGLDDPGSATEAEGTIKVRLAYEDTSGTPIILIGSSKSSRLEMKSLSIETGLYLDAQGKKDLYLELELQEGRLLITPGEGDGFLQEILPADGIGARFDLALGFSSLKGIYFRGSGGLEINIPTHLTLGPIELDSITISINVSGEELPIGLSASIITTLGPLKATVQNMGLTANFKFPGSGGNLGPVDLALKFKPPNAIGLSIDGGGFKGGGFLKFDYENERYEGILTLEFKEIVTINAIALITTRLPDGSKGFSLLIAISTEFTPVQLGYGFTLIGVGGLLGLNRTSKVDVLRQGIKTKTLESVLFPKDIVKNASRIISDLRQVFPPQEGRFVFGPMAKIGWGTPTLLTIDLGLIIEVPSPVKIVVMGVLKVKLPDEKLVLIKIQVNFIGTWEEDKQLISFDAALYDSNIGTYPIVGEMALRIGYGDNPVFLATVGGFHSAFIPPPIVQSNLKRLTVNLMKGNNPRLTMAAYFAITSNTVQLGAKIELLARAWKFNVYGFLAFDALFQFNPFYFMIGISGALVVRAGTRELFGVNLDLDLSGTHPWNAKGSASFKILGIKKKVRFNKTWGEEKDTTLPDVEVLPMLTEALGHKNNWEAKLPPRSHLLVSIGEIDDVESEHIVAHPAGELTVNQKVVPLDTTIHRFGSQKLLGGNKFVIDGVYSNDIELNMTDVEEYFIPAQFEEMDDAQKLSRKSFEKMPSGVKVSSWDNDIQSSKVVLRILRYETIIIDTRFRISRLIEKLNEKLRTFLSLLRGNSVSKSKLSFMRKAGTAWGSGKVTALQEKYTVVKTENLSPYDCQFFGSEYAAIEHMNVLISNDASLQGKIQVVLYSEMNLAA